MTWQRDIILKLLRFIELIGLFLLFLIKIISTIIKKAFVPIIIGILLLGLFYFGSNFIKLPF